MRSITQKMTALTLCVALLFTSIAALPVSAVEKHEPPVHFGVISDPHFFPENLIDIQSPEFMAKAAADSKLIRESEAIVRAALGTIAARKANGTYPMDFLLMPGDLTFDGERVGHLELAALLRDFERDTGIEVFVINGNHDVNNYNAANYKTASGIKETARENPDLLLTTPQMFRDIYADFGYNQADSVYIPEGGYGAGMLSYSAGLAGGYRLIAIDSCVYTGDVTTHGRDEKQGRMYIAPGTLDWVLKETERANRRGETVIGMVHGSVVEHFSVQRAVKEDAIIYDFERISYELADAGMHFIFTGHTHANDVASIISGNNEILFDIETCALSSFPNMYREAVFTKAPVAADVVCRLNNVDCDDVVRVDLGGVTEHYALIEKPFRETYAMPTLFGGSIEDGIRNDFTQYFVNTFLGKATDALKDALPNGLTGLLADLGIGPGSLAAAVPPALKLSLARNNLTAREFSDFLFAVARQIDEKYLFTDVYTNAMLTAAVARLGNYELAEGDEATALGKLLMLGMEYHYLGDEDPSQNPEIGRAIAALRTQEGADRLIEELLDTILNDVLMDELLPSIGLNELDTLLPARTMRKLRAVAGDDLSVGGLLDSVLNSAAERWSLRPFIRIDNGRDVLKVFVYAIGLPFIGAAGRRTVAGGLADLIESFTHDENPVFQGDSLVPLRYTGKVDVEPTIENYRLPADLALTKGSQPGEILVTWKTLPGIEGTDLLLSPSPSGLSVETSVRSTDVTVTVLDFGFLQMRKERPLLEHTAIVRGLEPGTDYTLTAGDAEEGLFGAPVAFTLAADGEPRLVGAAPETGFFEALIALYQTLFGMAASLKTIVGLLT